MKKLLGNRVLLTKMDNIDESLARGRAIYVADAVTSLAAGDVVVYDQKAGRPVLEWILVDADSIVAVL